MERSQHSQENFTKMRALTSSSSVIFQYLMESQTLLTLQDPLIHAHGVICILRCMIYITVVCLISKSIKRGSQHLVSIPYLHQMSAILKAPGVATFICLRNNIFNHCILSHTANSICKHFIFFINIRPIPLNLFLQVQRQASHTQLLEIALDSNDVLLQL